MSSGTAGALARKLTIDDLEVGGRRVLVRVDLNLPVQDGRVTDTTRLTATLPTLQTLLRRDAAVVVMSHRGRPQGERREDLGMAPVAEVMREALGRDVRLLPDCIGDEVERAVSKMGSGDVVLLENLRFHPGEIANAPGFAGHLAALADIYVNDAFGAAHRAHASTVGVAQLVNQAAAGRLLLLEVEMLSLCLDDPAEPFVLVAGGAKVSDKLDAVTHLLPLVDRLIIGGAMANSVLAAQGVQTGNSRIEEGSLELAGALIEETRHHGVEVLLPEDFVVASGVDAASEAVVVDLIPEDSMALDIGPRSAQRFATALAKARTVLWNGPMGVFEIDELAAGTRRIGEAIAAATDAGALTIVGGGDTAAAVGEAGLGERMSHVSTGGGAALELLSGAVLPGVEALSEAQP